MTRIALPDPLFCKVRDLRGVAVRTLQNAVRPAKFDHKLAAMLKIREPDDRVPESVGSLWCFHALSMPEQSWNVKYIITQTRVKVHTF